MKLTASVVEAFAGTFLSPLYDEPKPTPDLHRELWGLYCSDHPQCVFAAPRGHAKSTAGTHDYGLAVGLFREQDYIIVLGSTEEMAIDHLGDIAGELRTNDELIQAFGIKGFTTDQKTDIVVEFHDGHQMRYIARGGEQKIRGKKWRGKRPGLILGDDIEDDEQVESVDRRRKFYRWLMRAAKQALRDGGKMRICGTILHEDAALAKLLSHPSWRGACRRAHKSFDDFSNILWPEKFPEERLRAIRQEFIDANDAAGYSQEYLNDPLDNSDAYLRKEDFVPMAEEDRETSKIVCAAADFAISKADSANRTSLTIGGKDLANTLHFLDQRVGRWDALEIIEEMFSVQRAWNPDIFWVEDGQIWLSIKPQIFKAMQAKGIFINFVARRPIRDKASRGRSLQRRMRARATRWDKEASWYPGMEHELLRFTGYNQATLDDQFDSAALLSLGFDDLAEVETEDFMDDKELEDAAEWNRQGVSRQDGRSRVTGY